MAVTQEVVMNFLLGHGGKVKNSELVREFKPLVDSPDPLEKANNRELFKSFVNNIAVVKDEEGGKFVVLRKKYWNLLAERNQNGAREQDKEPAGAVQILPETRSLSDAVPSNQQRRPSKQDLTLDKEELQLTGIDNTGPNAQPVTNANEYNTADESSQNEKRESVFAIVARMDTAGPAPVPKAQSKESAQKPYMLPLRYPQPSSSFDDTEDQEENNYEQQKVVNTATSEITKPIQTKSPHVSRKQFDDAGSKSPHIKRSSKMIKVSEENKYIDVVPLDANEHEWLVKATSGRWNHRLHGLLLTESELAEKRDFISGFTALHWAAKSGNTDMIKTLIEVSKKAEINLNVNVKSHGGYTPLHIAAIHDHKDVVNLLVVEYNAKVHLRDYSGRKPYQYLKKGAPAKIRILLNDPQAHSLEQAIPAKRNSKVASSILGTTTAFLGVISDDIILTDLAKGLKKPGPLNKFFTAPAVHKKKLKPRDRYPSISSLNEEIEEEPGEPVGKRRPLSDYLHH
ncbi:ankyrin repeat domain-containing protein SOWAHA [Bombina bombina]|uniref:ankyrin repeat domain-containing protein SOWAHA n=1 Tax=Bombina bombina TaxID=8345 RepID=UPI00235A4B59|nr:ankyrin repeat domain-containing protein SOWAHA [Bombina bombina]